MNLRDGGRHFFTDWSRMPTRCQADTSSPSDSPVRRWSVRTIASRCGDFSGRGADSSAGVAGRVRTIKSYRWRSGQGDAFATGSIREKSGRKYVTSIRTKRSEHGFL